MKTFPRKTISLLSVILFISFFTACSNDAETKAETTENSMHLNKGEKWIANAETTDGIVRLGEQLEEFLGSENHSLEDYQELGILMSETMNQLVDQCSMEGEAHDQLHVFIVPIFKYIKVIKGDDLAQSKKAALDLSAHLEIYDKHFKLE